MQDRGPIKVPDGLINDWHYDITNKKHDFKLLQDGAIDLELQITDTLLTYDTSCSSATEVSTQKSNNVTVMIYISLPEMKVE